MFRNQTITKQNHFENLKLLSEILATSAGESTKRMYKDDMKPFTNVFSASCISFQIVKATIIPANLVMNDFNNQLTESERRGVPMPDFDWMKSFNKHFVTWPENFIRHYNCAFIKKVLEEIALHTQTARMVDKLTKDPLKSINRKFLKFGHITACQKIFKTYVWGNALTNLSLFLYDVVYSASRYLYETYKNNQETRLVANRRNYLQPVKAVYYVVNRAGFYSLSLVCAAAGYSAGSCLNYAYGGMLVSLLFQLGSDLGYNLLLPVD